MLYFRYMTVYEAIKEMRVLTEKGIPFSFSFMSFSVARQESAGLVQVRRAKLRRRGDKKHNRYAEHMEEYHDLDVFEDKHFWHCLLMEFNGQKVDLL